jgi:hypothetical protein
MTHSSAPLNLDPNLEAGPGKGRRLFGRPTIFFSTRIPGGRVRLL